MIAEKAFAGLLTERALGGEGGGVRDGACGAVRDRGEGGRIVVGGPAGHGDGPEPAPLGQRVGHRERPDAGPAPGGGEKQLAHGGARAPAPAGAGRLHRHRRRPPLPESRRPRDHRGRRRSRARPQGQPRHRPRRGAGLSGRRHHSAGPGTGRPDHGREGPRPPRDPPLSAECGPRRVRRPGRVARPAQHRRRRGDPADRRQGDDGTTLPPQQPAARRRPVRPGRPRPLGHPRTSATGSSTSSSARTSPAHAPATRSPTSASLAASPSTSSAKKRPSPAGSTANSSMPPLTPITSASYSDFDASALPRETAKNLACRF